MGEIGRGENIMLKPFTLRLNVEDMQTAKDLAPEVQRSFNDLIRCFIKYGIDHWEDRRAELSSVKPKEVTDNLGEYIKSKIDNM